MRTDILPDGDYILDGRTLERLFSIAERFNDGMVIPANERRDLAQEMLVKLEKALWAGTSR